MDKIILEGTLYNSESRYLVIVPDDITKGSVLLDDTLMRSSLLCQRVRITVELLKGGGIDGKYKCNW